MQIMWSPQIALHKEIKSFADASLKLGKNTPFVKKRNARSMEKMGRLMVDCMQSCRRGTINWLANAIRSEYSQAIRLQKVRESSGVSENFFKVKRHLWLETLTQCRVLNPKTIRWRHYDESIGIYSIHGARYMLGEEPSGDCPRGLNWPVQVSTEGNRCRQSQFQMDLPSGAVAFWLTRLTRWTDWIKFFLNGSKGWVERCNHLLAWAESKNNK